MRVPTRLKGLLEDNLIDDVVSQLMSGKEAEVFVVSCGGELRCAKIYKEVNNRSFKQMAQYTEGRSVRSSRQARAMNNKSRFGRRETENEWQRTEVDTLSLLARAGVSVPATYDFVDGVLIMEMVRDEHGEPAPRLHEVELSSEHSKEYFGRLLRDVVRMLCVGVVHGDLSEFNILLGHAGPVIIDLPQAVQATANNAFSIFEHDIAQLTAYFGRFEPEILRTQYAKEIWQIYRSGRLTPDTPLTGQFTAQGKRADLGEVFAAIQGAFEDDQERRGIRKETAPSQSRKDGPRPQARRR